MDNHPPFIRTLKRKARQAGCADRIRCVVGDMKCMDFPAASFDAIWSEGAAFIMGFDGTAYVNGIEKALKAWRPLLRPKGYTALSELVWFREDVPQEAADYFAGAYPDMKYYERIHPLVESAGYRMIDYFPLPAEAWWTGYYTPAEKKLAALRRKYRDNADAQAVFDSFQSEIDVFRKYSQYYGYGFYVMRKRES